MPFLGSLMESERKQQTVYANSTFRADINYGTKENENISYYLRGFEFR